MRRSPATAPGRRRRLIRIGCPRNCRRAGEGPAAVVWDECAPCTARHSERNGADCGKSLRGGGLSARDVRTAAGSGRTSGSGRLGRMCALRSAAFRKERCRLWEIPPRRRLIRAGCSRTLPQGAGERPAAADAGGCEKTAGSRKIDENLIFGTRAFVFYPLSLAAPKILRLNKIANKFAFVSGLFVSLRLKPKYANRP